MYEISRFQVSAQRNSFFAYSSSIALEGEPNTTPETPPTVIPELQTVISVVHSHSNFGALTSGRLLTWGRYSEGAQGLGNPGGLPVGSPGGHVRGEQRVRAKKYGYPQDVTIPTEVRFDHGLASKGRVERYCVAAAAGGWNVAALVINLAGDEIPPEDLEPHFEKTVPRERNNPDSSARTTRYGKACCLV